jgi:acetyl-CoA carboxylase biotin carboxyl carrier protein
VSTARVEIQLMSEEGTLQPENETRGQSTRPAGEHRGGRDRGRRRHPQQQQGRRQESMFNLDELRDLVELIAAHGFTEFELEREGIKVRLRRDLGPQVSAPAQNAAANPAATHIPIPSSGHSSQVTTHDGLPPAAPHPGAQAEAAASVDEDLEIISSPIVGTFYRAPSPNADSFVNLGSKVAPDTVVCIIEAMKLMNEIQAETHGAISKIYVENGQAVEYGQPLFGIKPNRD